MPKITTIINYCSNEYGFITHCIRESLSFSDKVIVPICDHFFSGEPERQDLLNKTYEENPAAHFIEIPFSTTLRKKYGAHFWHNAARWIAVQSIPDDTDFVLFLDADEVVDSRRFVSWLDSTSLENVDAIKFLSYWYFRDVMYQAKTMENAGVMVRVKNLRPRLIFSDSERHALCAGPTLHDVLDPQGIPLVHHYSWVRTKQEMLRKVNSWGHTGDRKNWVELVEEEFSHTFTGRDFVHNYEFNTITPFLTLPVEIEHDVKPVPAQANDYSHVTRLTKDERDRILNKRSIIGRLMNRLSQLS